MIQDPRLGKISKFFLAIFYNYAFTSVESFLAVLCLLAGIPILISLTSLAPSSLLVVLPTWTVLAWASALVSGGLFTLVGVGIGDILVERSGVALLGSGAFVLCSAILLTAPSLVGTLTYGLFGLAMVARYWTLGLIRKVSLDTLHRIQLMQLIQTPKRRAKQEGD